MAEFNYKAAVKEISHHLSPAVEDLLTDPAVLMNFHEEIVKLAETEPRRSNVPILAYDVNKLVDNMRDEGNSAYCMLHKLIEEQKARLSTSSNFDSYLSPRLDMSELFPRDDPISHGPFCSTDSKEEITKFREEFGPTKGVCSRDVIQNDPTLTDWTFDEVHVFRLGEKEARNLEHPSGTWQAPKVVEPPISCSNGNSCYGVSFSKEKISFEAKDVVVDGVQSGVMLPSSDLHKLARRVRRDGNFSPTFPGEPLRITKKIDGLFCYFKVGSDTSYLQFRNGDYAKLNNGFDIKMGLEFVEDQGFYLLYVHRWRFFNPIGFKFVDELLDRKEMVINWRGRDYPILDVRRPEAPCDGIVAHYLPGVRQFFFKDVSTVDVNKSVADIITKNHGVTFNPPVPDDNLVYEYEYVNHECNLVKVRPDKLKPNQLYTIEKVLSTQTAENFLDTFPDVESFV